MMSVSKDNDRKHEMLGLGPMLGIYARSFMTATRTGTEQVRDVPPERHERKKRWLPRGHWFVQSTRDIDPNKL